MLAFPDFVGRTWKSAMLSLPTFSVTFLPPGSVIVTLVPASTERVRTRIVVSSLARSLMLLAVESAHAPCAAETGLTAPCGTAGGAGGACGTAGGAGGVVTVTVHV